MCAERGRYNQLEALRERRPPWPRQIITLILPTVKMLSLGCERLPPPRKKKKKKKKVLDHYLQDESGYATTIMVFFAHLLILQYPDHHQNVISSSLYYSGPVHKISSQSVHNFLSNVVHEDVLTNKHGCKTRTNAVKNITSFAKEVYKEGSKHEDVLTQGFVLFNDTLVSVRTLSVLYDHYFS